MFIFKFNLILLGRILNRFSKDMGAIDEMLPVALMDCIQVTLNITDLIIFYCTIY